MAEAGIQTQPVFPGFLPARECSFAITLDGVKALSEVARLETADRGSGLDHWTKQPTGLAGVAIEAEAHWLRSEALPLSSTLGEMTDAMNCN